MNELNTTDLTAALNPIEIIIMHPAISRLQLKPSKQSRRSMHFKQLLCT